MTCSDACALEHRRRIQREAKRREYSRDREKLLARQRARQNSATEKARLAAKRQQEIASRPPKLCAGCGAEIARSLTTGGLRGNGNARKYCSSRCGEVHRRRLRGVQPRPVRAEQPRRPETRNCMVCGEEHSIAGKRHKRLTCSDPCRLAWSAYSKREKTAENSVQLGVLAAINPTVPVGERYERICVMCGTRFESSHSQRVTCSHECRRARNNAAKRTRRRLKAARSYQRRKLGQQGSNPTNHDH